MLRCSTLGVESIHSCTVRIVVCSTITGFYWKKPTKNKTNPEWKRKLFVFVDTLWFFKVCWSKIRVSWTERNRPCVEKLKTRFTHEILRRFVTNRCYTTVWFVFKPWTQEICESAIRIHTEFCMILVLRCVTFGFCILLPVKRDAATFDFRSLRLYRGKASCFASASTRIQLNFLGSCKCLTKNVTIQSLKHLRTRVRDATVKFFYTE